MLPVLAPYILYIHTYIHTYILSIHAVKVIPASSSPVRLRSQPPSTLIIPEIIRGGNEIFVPDYHHTIDHQDDGILTRRASNIDG